MEKWKQIALWGLVAVLVFSFAVCQKKTEQAKTEETAKETAITAAPEAETKLEEAEELTEDAKAKLEKEVKAAPSPEAEAEKVKAEAEKVAEEKLVKAEKKASEAEAKLAKEAAVTEPAKEIAREDAAAIIELAKGGKIIFEFHSKDAPNTVDNFIKLTNKGFYDGLTFHRVIADFMAQGGCPLGSGTGGPGYKIKAEFNSQKHVRGTVAMARSTHPDSAGSQFYICYGSQPHLDGEYTVFGQVVKGMELVDAIKQGDVMKKVTIVDKASIE